MQLLTTWYSTPRLTESEVGRHVGPSTHKSEKPSTAVRLTCCVCSPDLLLHANTYLVACQPPLSRSPHKPHRKTVTRQSRIMFFGNFYPVGLPAGLHLSKYKNTKYNTTERMKQAHPQKKKTRVNLIKPGRKKPGAGARADRDTERVQTNQLPETEGGGSTSKPQQIYPANMAAPRTPRAARQIPEASVRTSPLPPQHSLRRAGSQPAPARDTTGHDSNTGQLWVGRRPPPPSNARTRKRPLKSKT